MPANRAPLPKSLQVAIDAVVDQPLQEPERCGSPFLFDRVKKLLAGEHPPPSRALDKQLWFLEAHLQERE
jgi:hypothetical protein